MASVPVETAATPKRIALFLDGTWNTVDDNTNVWRLKSLCASQSADGLTQVIYYSTGVGTTFGRYFSGGMLGYGLNDEIIHAYEWLIDQYEPADELFIFGFSRGAYTARSLSGLISKCGLLTPGAPLSVQELYARYRRGSAEPTIRELLQIAEDRRADLPLQEQWMLRYSQAIDVKFLGVWDTVGALGLPFGNLPILGKADMQFLNTGLRVSNKYAFHALAIDEHRKAFAPTLWTVDFAKNTQGPHTHRTLDEVEQRWFVGAHANVGGGYMSDCLPQLPLKWIMEKAAARGLSFRRQVDVDTPPIPPPITDSYAKFAYGFYKAATLRQPYYRPIGEAPQESSETELRESINETIDASVFARWRADSNYRPRNLKQWADRHQLKTETLQSSVRCDDPTVVV